MARRPHITLMLVVGVILFVFTTYMLSSSGSSGVVQHSEPLDLGGSSGSGDHKSASGDGGSKSAFGISDNILKGGSIAPKLENATAKYVYHVHYIAPYITLCPSGQASFR